MVDHTSVWDTMVKIFWKFAAPSSISRVYPERDPSAHSRRCSNNLCQTCFGSWDLCGSSLKWKKPVVEKSQWGKMITLSHPWPTFSANLTSSTFLIWAASKPPQQINKISTNLQSSWHGESKPAFFFFWDIGFYLITAQGVFLAIFYQRPPKSRLNPGSLRPFSPEPRRNFPSSFASAILAAARAAVRGHRPPERGNPRAPAAPSGARVLVASRVWDLKRREEMKERGATHTMILDYPWKCLV